MANRYTRLSTAQFSPFSMQEIFTVPLAKQALHDQVMASADELGLFDIQTLDADKEAKDTFVSGLTKEVDDLTSDVMSKGINSMARSKLQGLIKKRNKWLKAGEGMQMTREFQRYQQNKEDLDKMYQKGDIGRDVYLRGLQESVGNYQGIAAGDQYTAFTPVLDTNYEEEARKVAQAVSNNPIKMTQFSGLQYNSKTGKYYEVKTNKEYTPQDAIRFAVSNTLMSNPEIVADLRQRERLGLLNGMSINEYVGTLGNINEGIYAKNNYNQSKQYVGIDHKQIDKAAGPGSNYVYGADRTVALAEDKLINKLGNIIEGNTFTEINPEPGKPIPGANVRGASFQVEGTYENLKDQEKATYNFYFNKLKESEIIDKNANLTDKESLQTVKDYMESVKDFTYQPVKYTNGIYLTYDSIGSKTKASTPENLAKGVSLQAETKLWLDPDKNSHYSSFDKVPDKYRKELTEGKAKVSAVYGPRNLFKLEFPDVVEKSKLASLYEVQFTDGKKLLASRDEGETNTKAYKVADAFNDLWIDLSAPDVNIRTVFPDGKPYTLRRNRDYSIDIIGGDGRPVRLNGNHFFENDDDLEQTFTRLSKK